MGDNMESMLLGGGDSSSGESDTEEAVSLTPSTAAPTITAPMADRAPPAPTPASASSFAMSFQERSQKLKEMYSPAGSRPPQHQTQAIHLHHPASVSHQPIQQQQQQAVSRPHQPQAQATHHPSPVQHQTIHQNQPIQPQQQPSQAPPSLPQQHQQNIAGRGSRGSLGIPIQQQMPSSSGIPQQRLSNASISSGGGIQHQQQPQVHNTSGGISMSASTHMAPLSQARSSGGVPHQQIPSSQEPPRHSAMVPQQRAPSSLPHQQIPQASRNMNNSRSQNPMQAPSARSGAVHHTPSDPFEPTPVSTIIQRQTHSAPTGHNSTSNINRSGYPPTTSQQQQILMDRERELKRAKERFLIFTRVLMKYLEQKDKPLHLQVKGIIKDCAEKNRQKVPGYESVTQSMRKRLKEVVNEGYWKRAEAYLDHFLKEKAKSGSQSALQLQSDSETRKKAQAQAAVMLARQKQMLLNQQKSQQPKMPQTSSNIHVSALQSDLQKQREELTDASKRSTSSTKSSTQTAKQAPKPKGKRAAQPRKSSLSSQTTVPSTATTAKTTTANPTTNAAAQQEIETQKTQPPLPKISVLHHQLMEQVDNATNYDWTVAGSILGQETEWVLTEEQSKLLYDSKSTIVATSEMSETVASVPVPDPVNAFPIAGWSTRNVISSRVAWARVRLQEVRQKPQSIDLPTNRGATDKLKITVDDVYPSPTTMEAVASSEWVNEEVAEQDTVLAVLSEGVEQYLKSVLQKALHSAQQRQNVDGIRLWHQQYTSRGPTGKTALSLRLGCDQERQVARTVGNAAATCQRMEEALARQASRVTDMKRELNNKTLSQVTSMSTAALLPKLGNAVENADRVKRSNFDVYGGRNAEQPPFGRLPKRAQLEIVDFQKGMDYVRPGRRKHRAITLSSSFQY